MMITRESDYGIRIIRALKDGEQLTIYQICDQQSIPRQFAYKILKKLDNAGLVQIRRGYKGGCLLARDLSEITLYDVIRATDEQFFLTHCLQEGYQCDFATRATYCTVHRELTRVQGVLEQELKSRSMKDVLEAPVER